MAAAGDRGDQAARDVRRALDDISEAASAYSIVDERSGSDHESGEPLARPFVPAGEDPRDIELEETPLSEDLVWRGRIFDVHRMDVRVAGGNLAQRDIVRHPGAVAIVALTDDGRICLVRQYRAPIGRITVELPAGKLDPGEDPIDCARRELLEETGMEAGKLAFLTSLATSVGFTDELIHLYMATELSFKGSSPDADEYLNVDLVDVGELVDAVLDGKVEDAKTIVGALLCDAISRRLE